MRWAACLLGVASVLAVGAAAQAPRDLTDVQRRLEALSGTGRFAPVVQAAGVTRDGLVLHALEAGGIDPGRRLVLVAGLDGDARGTEAALRAARWFYTEAGFEGRRDWSLSVLPCGNPEGWLRGRPENGAGGLPTAGYPPSDRFFDDPQAPETRYVWRWIAFQGPDLVIDLRGGDEPGFRLPAGAPAGLRGALRARPMEGRDSLAGATGSLSGLGGAPAVQAEARAEDGPEILRRVLAAASKLPPSEAHGELRRRQMRTPLQIARSLAARYPQTPSITYIPAVAWSGALRLARLSGEERWRQQVRDALAPYLTGARPALVGNPEVAKLAGHIAFADLAEADNSAPARRLALEAAARYLPDTPDGYSRFGRFWTDDMFMTHTLLGRAARLSGERRYADVMARSVLHYASRLQRPDGIFIHAPDGPHAWGRGNGFAALGLMETLTYLPESHPQRGAVLAVYRRQMSALRDQQAADGTWRQVIDRRESYREVTSTAMNLAAMARGLRLKWLDESFRLPVDRAWQGLLSRVGDDGTLVDVCAGTGAGPTLRYYLDRPALTGLDDRGGAMTLLAALEMVELERQPAPAARRG